MGSTSSQTRRHFWPPSVFLRGAQQSSDHQNQGSWCRETPQCRAGECRKGQPWSRLDSPQARGFSALCLLQTGTLRVGATDGPSWEAAPQRGSLKLFSSLEFQESPSEQKDSPGPQGGRILRILTHCRLALRCGRLDPIFASVAACPLPVFLPGLQHCELICPLGCLFSTLVSLYPQGRK